MKTKLLITSLLISGVASAQITVNSTDFISIGDSFGIGESQAVTTNDSPGANKIWNYTNLDTVYGADIYSYVSPSVTGSGAQFPGANLAEDDQSGDYLFYGKTATSFIFYGLTDGSMSFAFSNPRTDYSFPITFGGTHSDNFEFSITEVGDGNPGDPDSIRETLTGTLSYKVDSWGTLVMPNGSFDALRIRDTLIEIYTEEELFSGVWTVSDIDSDTTIRNVFVSNNPSSRKELLVQEIDEFGTVDYNYWDVSARNFLSINENKLNFDYNIFPNPTQNILNIQSDFLFDEYTVTDLLGKIIRNEKTDLINQIDVSSLESGNYILTLKNNKGEVSKKFVKN